MGSSWSALGKKANPPSQPWGASLTGAPRSLFWVSLRSLMAVVATGSIAFDYILTFKGRFGDHIIPDKAHIIKLSFLVETMQRPRGGLPGNYPYTLAPPRHPPAVPASARAPGARDKARP